MYFLISWLKKTNKLCSTEYISTPRSNMIICKIYNKMLQNLLNPYTTYDIWWCESASFSTFVTVINWFLLSPDSWPKSLCTDISKPLSVQQHFTFLFWISSLCQFCVWTLTSSVSHLFYPMWLTSPEVFVCAILRRALKLLRSRALSPSRVQTWLTHPLYRSILKVSSLSAYPRCYLLYLQM